MCIWSHVHVHVRCARANASLQIFGRDSLTGLECLWHTCSYKGALVMILGAVSSKAGVVACTCRGACLLAKSIDFVFVCKCKCK